MKKSLNNVFKGKRLVTGDENEMTQHEILLKEEDGKVVMKERSTDGTIQEIGSSSNGGSSSSAYTGFSLMYYWQGSHKNKSGNLTSSVKTIRNADFTEFDKIYDTLANIDKPDDFINGNACCFATIETPFQTILKDPDGSLDYGVKDNKGNTITKYYTRDSRYSYTHYVININKTCSDILGYLNSIGAGNPVTTSDGICNSYFIGTSSSMYLTVDALNNGIFYDIKNNILYYYSNISAAYDYIHIYPESLADTIKVYGDYYHRDQGASPSCVKINGKEIPYTNIE